MNIESGGISNVFTHCPKAAKKSSSSAFLGGAAAAEVDEAGFSSDRQKGSLLPKWLGTAVDEVASYAEDPHVTERWVFSQQKKMGD